jgi:hypothetical protein
VTNYQIQVRLELREADTGKVITYDNHDHYFSATGRVNGGCNDYMAIDDAIANAIHALNVENESTG